MAKNATDLSRLIPLRDAAEALAVSPHTLRHWARLRAISHVRFAGKIMFERTLLDRFIDEHAVPAEQQGGHAA